MDDMKDKMKGLMKKVNFSSSSGKFKGQGRTLGSSQSQSQSQPSNSRILQSSSVSKPPVQKPSFNSSKESQKEVKIESLPQKEVKIESLPEKESETKKKIESLPKQDNGFDPYNSLVTSGKRNPNGLSLNVFECPVCTKVFGSEEEVSDHVETCLSNATESSVSLDSEKRESESIVSPFVSAYVSGKPSEGSKEVVLRLLRNVVKEPDNAKFRKVRIGNPKIKEAIGDVVGGIELLECVGFELVEESGEMWLVMGVPTDEQVGLVGDVVALLEPKKKVEELPSTVAVKEKEKEVVVPVKVDRQIRVFFSVPESVAARIEVPESFYNLSAAELKREAEMKRKKLEESNLLIPKSYREKMAKAARRRYKRTMIRIQFPDGVVLQAVFSPSELTGALYEFVSSALKEPSLEFELLHPVLVKRRVIPHSPGVTLDEEDLIPSALIKFKPIETENVVFTGLCNELLEISEPLVSQ